MDISAVIFDMDGLMLDTERIAQAAWERAVAELGYGFPVGFYVQFIGITVQDVERLTRRVFGEDFPFQEAFRRKQQYVQDLISEHGIPLKPGLLELLDEMDGPARPGEAAAKTLFKAVASSSVGEIVRRNFQVAGLPLERFEAVVSGEEVQKGKPAPDIYLLAGERLKAPAGRCLVLEDSNAGIRAAHAAGMIPVMIPDLVAPDEEVKTLAYRILPSLGDVTELIFG